MENNRNPQKRSADNDSPVTGRWDNRRLTIDYVSPQALRPNPHPARRHPKQQLKKLARSIAAFGFTNPVLVDEQNQIIAGQARYQVAVDLNLATIPVIQIIGLNEAERRALALADNRLAEEASWDPERLVVELEYLLEIPDVIDVDLAGFEIGEVDALIHAGDPSVDEAEAFPLDPSAAVVSRPGDLWLIGRHRLLCGDATHPEDFAALLGGARADLVFVDPPYNVPIDGHVSGLGRNHHDEFAMASGEMSPAQFTSFLECALGLLAKSSADGAIHYVCMDWRHLRELLAAGDEVYTELKNICVWSKSNAGMGSLYRSQHELVLVFKKGRTRHVNNVELGRNGRHRSNIWHYPGVNTFRPGRDEELALHPTVKPVALVADAILDCSKPNGLVLDSFVGSGTTLLAAEQTGRRAAGMEIDPRYVDVALARFEAATGIHPRHSATGLTLEEIRTQRVDIDEIQESTRHPDQPEKDGTDDGQG